MISNTFLLSAMVTTFLRFPHIIIIIKTPPVTGGEIIRSPGPYLKAGVSAGASSSRFSSSSRRSREMEKPCISMDVMYSPTIVL